MRTVSIRQFQQNFHAELRNVPFVITKRKIPVFTLTAISGNNVVTSKLKHTVAKPKLNVVTTPKPKQDVTTQPKIKSEEKPSSLKKCPHGVLIGIGFCNKGCKM